jgi:cytochrome c biogenesis protein CcdA
MNRTISFQAVGNASSLFLLFTFSICVAFDLLFPEHAMFKAWQDLLPGFEFINWKSFILGAFESYLYGWYFALIWVPLYNYFVSKNKTGGSCCH